LGFGREQGRQQVLKSQRLQSNSIAPKAVRIGFGLWALGFGQEQGRQQVLKSQRLLSNSVAPKA
jgi:hypothetical protein